MTGQPCRLRAPHPCALPPRSNCWEKGPEEGGQVPAAGWGRGDVLTRGDGYLVPEREPL